MKNWDDVVTTARTEVEKWFPAQCRNQYKRFFWKYTETTKEAPGKIWIADTEDDEAGYWLYELKTGETKEQNLSNFLKLAGRLPILEYE